MTDEKIKKPRTSNLALRAGTTGLAPSSAEPRSYDDLLFDMVSGVFGQMPPLTEISDLHSPAEKARHMAEALLFYAKFCDEGDTEQRLLAAAFIDRFWQAYWRDRAPHVRFMHFVFSLAPRYHHANVIPAVLAGTLIKAFTWNHSRLAGLLDPELVQEALRCANLDGRKGQKEKKKTKWVAIAEAWASTGDVRKPGTFKVDWNREVSEEKRRQAWAANR